MTQSSNLSVEKEKFLVIGLVGAVGSSLKTLSNILKSVFRDEFSCEVEEISISKKFLEVNNPTYQSQYDRYEKLMDAGNKIRKDKKTDFLALQTIDYISKRRKIKTTDKTIKVFIINSLKHDAEIKTLRDVYGQNFFQISIYESKANRKNVLVNDVGMTESEAEKLIDRDEGEKNDYGQHTIDAFHLADYFINYDIRNTNHIKNSCFRFISLLFGNPYITPTFNEYAMYMAFTSSLRSADLSRQVGSVISINRNIIATGANDVPKFGGGQYWPEFNMETGDFYELEKGRDSQLGFDSNERQRNAMINEIFESIKNNFQEYFNEDEKLHKKNLDKLYSLIEQSSLKDITEYGRVVHAEMDAILSCGRTNNSTIGSSMFVTTFPCHNCAKHIISSGIKEVFFIEPYPKSKAIELWKDSIAIEKTDNKVSFQPFVGVGPRSFLNLFSISHGAGKPIKRKEYGEIVQWKSLESNLRLSGNIYSLNEVEKKITDEIMQLEDNFRD